MKHVAVLMGGWSAERPVSLNSGRGCADALEAARATPGSVRAKSVAVGEAYLNFAFDHPHTYKLMFDLNQELGTTLVLVTHDQGIARRCQRQLTIDAGRLLGPVSV